MANNRIEIDITANDRATVVINNLNDNLGRISKTGNIAQIALGNLASAGLIAGLNAVSGAIGKITSGLSEAAKLQTSFLTAANSTGLNLKISLPEAEEIQKQLGKAVSIAAASQPGNNQDYLTIANAISGSVAKAYQGRPKEFLDATTQLVKGAGLLTVAANVDPTSAGTTIGRFVNGTSSFNQLRLIDFFEKNPDLVQRIDAVAKQRGLETEKLQQWTQEQRISVFNAAVGQIVTPEFLARLNNTAEAKLQMVQSSLFDQQTGLFGFMREIPKLGNLSVLDSFNNLLTTILGVSETASKLANALGITIDPMYVLASGINNFNDVLVKVGSWLGALDPSKLKFNGGLGDIGANITKWLNKGISGLLNAVETFDGVAFGRWLASITNLLMRNIASIVINFDWYKAFLVLTTLPSKIFEVALGFISNFDYGTLFATLTGMVVAVIANAVKFIQHGLDRNTERIFNALDLVANNLLNVWDNFMAKLKAGFDAIISRIQSLIPNLPNVGEAVRGAGGAILDAGKNGLDAATKLLTPKAEAKPVAYAPSVTVNASAGADSQSIVDQVLTAMEQQYNSFRNSALA